MVVAGAELRRRSVRLSDHQGDSVSGREVYGNGLTSKVPRLSDRVAGA